jgi:hypothetical protein
MNDSPKAPDDATGNGRQGIRDPLTGGDNEHLEFAQARGESSEVAAYIRHGLFLFVTLLESAPHSWQLTFDNDFSAAACFARTARQLRAATLLVFMGYYSEVGTVLRGAYESAALARFLAHEPEQAAKWLRKGTWFPDREVRRWFQDGEDKFAAIYTEFSADAHPTARSCLGLVTPTDEGYSLRFHTTFDAEAFDHQLMRVLYTTVWACFALRNAAAREEVLPPDWRRALSDYAREAVPHAEWSHLERQWEEEQAKWEAMTARVRSVRELDAELESNPKSVQNLFGQETTGQDE